MPLYTECPIFCHSTPIFCHSTPDIGLGIFRLGDDNQTLSELQQLVESRSARQDEWGRVEHDAVANARGVGVRDEAVIRPIVC